jgi:hypothetical protein
MFNIVVDKVRKNSNKVFYVCSFGGCGSKMLCTYLSNFGKVKHVHSRVPPVNLTHIGINEWFGNVPVNPKDLPNHYVIYIYRDPIKAILSRFTQIEHLQHIQTNPKTTLQDVIERKKDLYGIEEFFDNYTNTIVKRNYKIYCVKYEELFTHIEEFNKVLNINSRKELHPIEKTNKKPFTNDVIELYHIYNNLLERMKKMKFITIV